MLPKVHPKVAFESLNVKELDAAALGNLFGAMGVTLPGLDMKFRAEAIKEMNGGSTDAVSFSAFTEWWSTTGAEVVLPAQSTATGRVSMHKCKSVSNRADGDRVRIRLDTSEQILSFSLPKLEDAMRAEAGDTDHASWTNILSAAVPDQVMVANWGPSMQDRTDQLLDAHLRAGASTSNRSARLRNLSKGQRRVHSARMAEQRVRNAYDFCNGDAAAKKTMLNALFDQFDHDKSGALDVTEVKQLLKQLREPAPTIGGQDVKVAVKRSEIEAMIKEMEDANGTGDSRDGRIQSAEFQAWWTQRVTDRRDQGLVEEHWAEMRGRASLEFAAAIDIYSEIEAELKNDLMELVGKATNRTKSELAVSAKHLGAAAAEADVKLLFEQYANRRHNLEYEGALKLLQHLRVDSGDPKDKHTVFHRDKLDRMWDRMDRKVHGTKVETVDWAAFEKWMKGRAENHRRMDRPGEY
eukprot:COSAG06_NODE_10128_length_1744_cov_5.497558_2_plen_465_part_01